MKIVQSYWSKPANKKKNLNPSDRAGGGWPDKKYNYICWALSCLQFKKFYDDVELVTDQEGYELLINRLNLPYTKVIVCLDNINHYHADLWAIGKLYAYSIQNEPFIHADGDVYINKRFDESFENSALLCQSLEKGFVFYQKLYEGLEKNFNYIPQQLAKIYSIHGNLIAVNAGILGGNNLDFFKLYTREAFKFVDQNIDRIDQINIGMFNAVFEQALFYALTVSHDLDVTCLLNNTKQGFDGLCDLITSPDKNSYIHAASTNKSKRNVGYLLADRLLSDYPEYYFRILNLLKTHQV